jgi:hypothetical protein
MSDLGCIVALAPYKDDLVRNFFPDPGDSYVQLDTFLRLIGDANPRGTVPAIPTDSLRSSMGPAAWPATTLMEGCSITQHDLVDRLARPACPSVAAGGATDNHLNGA